MIKYTFLKNFYYSASFWNAVLSRGAREPSKTLHVVGVENRWLIFNYHLSGARRMYIEQCISAENDAGEIQFIAVERKSVEREF